VSSATAVVTIIYALVPTTCEAHSITNSIQDFDFISVREFNVRLKYEQKKRALSAKSAPVKNQNPPPKPDAFTVNLNPAPALDTVTPAESGAE
jgi:hypothetical protein